MSKCHAAKAVPDVQKMFQHYLLQAVDLHLPSSAPFFQLRWVICTSLMLWLAASIYPSCIMLLLESVVLISHFMFFLFLSFCLLSILPFCHLLSCFSSLLPSFFSLFLSFLNHSFSEQLHVPSPSHTPFTTYLHVYFIILPSFFHPFLPPSLFPNVPHFQPFSAAPRHINHYVPFVYPLFHFYHDFFPLDSSSLLWYFPCTSYVSLKPNRLLTAIKVLC